MHRLRDIVSSDIGFGESCSITGDGREIRYRSCVKKLNADEKDEANYIDDTGYYLVGDEAVDRGAPERPSTDSSFYASDEFRILMLYALQELKVKNPVLITGLPVERFDEMKPEHIKRIKNFPKKLMKENAFEFNRVEVIKQPYGTMFDPKLKTVSGESLKIADSRIGIIDIGDGTTDGVEAANGKPNSTVNYGLHEGVSDIHRSILNGFNSSKKFDLGNNITLHHVDKWLKKGWFPYKGENIDLDTLKFVQQAKTGFLPTITSVIQKCWGNINTLNYVVISGGGASVLGREALGTLIPEKQLAIPPDSGASNARGYLAFIIQLLTRHNLIIRE